MTSKITRGRRLPVSKRPIEKKIKWAAAKLSTFFSNLLSKSISVSGNEVFIGSNLPINSGFIGSLLPINSGFIGSNLPINSAFIGSNLTRDQSAYRKLGCGGLR